MALYDGTNGPTIKVYIDNGQLGSGYFVLGYSVLGSTPGDVLHTYTPFASLIQLPSTDVRGIAIRRGRTREDQTFQPGTATITLDNRSGYYDPQMLYATYSSGSNSMIAAGTGIRVTATWSGTEYNVYSGFIEQVDIDQSLEPVVVITCVDGLKQLGNINTSGWIGTYNSTIVPYLLRQAGWRSSSTVGAGTTAYYYYAPVLNNPTPVSNLLDELAQNQGGRFFVDRSGNVVFDGYDEIVPATTSLYLSDQRTSGTIEYDAITVTPGSKYLLNSIIFTMYDNSLTQTNVNAPSAIKYGSVSKNQTVYWAKSGGVFASGPKTIMQYLADKFANPTYRVDSVEFDVMNLDGFGGSVWPSFLALEIGKRVSVARTPVYTTATTYDCLVQSIDHDITPDRWRTSLQLSPAS